MAGPSFIHYNTTTNVVTNVFTTTQTAPGGQTQVNETHPTFIPSPSETRWQRTGVGAYTDIGPGVGPNDPDAPVPITQTWSFNGVIVDVDANEVVSTSWGSSNTSSPMTVIRDGECIGFSATLESARTAGTVTIRFTINGVQTTGAANELVINATNPSFHRIILDTPIQFSAGNRITLTATSSSFAPIDNDITVCAWIRDR
jgi:hypothetical protein